ncbi:YadA-like family protein [Neisseria elongata]|uniref:YadA-like family protein n=1 Tax=Neisseria elongata subsp. nitroreducens TaxID=90367 RepID=A0A9X0ZV58_NEIEL|nr:YadA-like family protein [Neisseria elongata]MBS9339881.1 YadA-like family protein [Neisseria elongata subsp. nitroreducens]
MNKIFKIVWNNSIGSYTVVSELTKSKSKGATCTTVAAVMLLAASQALAGTGTTTSGGNALPSGTDYKFCYYDDNSKNVVCGDSSTTAADVVGGNKPGKSVAIGLSAKTAGESNVALGANSSASSTSGLAIGADSKAHHNQTVAIGERANALGEADVAIGKAASENATSTGRNIAVGEGALRNAAAANNVIGIGTGAAQNINGQHVIAIGTDANQGVSNVNQVVAIGYKSSAVTSQSVAVGTLSSAKGIGSLALGNSSNAATENSVAVGRFSQAAGANSIAVGGGRSAAQSARAGGTYSIAVGAGAEATHAQSIAMGLSAGAKGTGTMAVGDSALASKNYAIAIGNKAEASGEKSVVIGSNETATNIAKATGRQSVAIGWTAQATGFTQAVAIGPDAQASGGQSTSIGNNTRANGNSSIAIGSDDWDLAKVQVDADYQRLTGTAMSTGYQSTEAAEAAIAVGVKTQATGALSTAFGPGARATKVGASAFGVGAEADKEKAVAIGAGSRTSTVATPVTSATVNGVTYSGFAGATKITDGSQISIGTAGYERQIKHVAPGEISATSTDAINGSQLYHVAAQAANPLKFDGDSGTTVERKLGTTLNVKGGATGTLTDNNIGVVADKAGNTLRLKLAQNVDLGNAGSLKTGNTTVNNNGLTINNGPSVNNNGINAGNKPITNVASGGTTDSNAANIGDVKKAAAAAKTVVKQGANTTVSSATDAATGATEYTVNAEKSVVQGSSDVSVNAATNGLTTTYTADLSTTAKTSLAKADSALQNIGIQVNGTTAKTLNQANSTLNFVNGTGTTAENKNGGIAFNVNKANLSVNGGTVSADKNGDEFATAKSVADAINQAVTGSEKTSIVAAGDNTHVASAVSGNQTTYTVHADKATVSAKAGGKLALNSTEVTNSNQTKTTNYELDLTDAAKAEIAKGVEAKTAVDTQGIGFAADSGSAVTKKLGDSLNIKGDNKNITTKTNNGDIQVTLNDDISVQNVNASASVITPKVVAGDSTLTSDGLNITGGPSITKTGISAGNKPITNVASGGTTDSNAANIGDVKKAAAAAKTVVKQGANTTVSSATNAATGATEYTVNAEKSVVQGSSDVSVNAVTNGLTTTYTADLSTTAKASLAKADSAVQKVVSSNSNLTASKTGDTVTLNFSQTPSFTSVTTGNSVLTSDGLKIGSGTNSVSLTNAGLSNGGNKITNIADGAADTDAASFKQVKAAKTEVQAGTNVASVIKTDGANGQAIYTVNAKAAAVALENGADGLKLTSAEDTTSNLTTYKLDLADKTKTSLAKANSALQNIGVQVNGTTAKTLNQANSTLNFVNGTGTTAENKNGNIAFNVNKANLSVNGGTVSADKQGDQFATAKSVADAINQAVTNSEKTSVVAAGDNTHVASAVSGNQTTYTVHADKTTVSAKTGGKLTVTSAQTSNANQTKTTNYELDLTDAAKAEIAKGVEAKTAVDTKGIGFAADSGSPVTKKLGDSLNIKGDNKNIETVAGSSGINVKLKDQITVKTAKADTFKAGDSTLNSDGLKISNGANPVELTKSGLNNGGNKITKVAKGTADTDAVNLAQLKDAAAAASNKVESGNANIVVKPVNNADGSTTYKVATADKLTADSFTAGNTVVNNGGVKVGNAVALGNDGLKAGNVSVGTNGINAGNHAVKNVAKGVNDTDAVNVAQLREQIAAGVKTTTVVAGKNVTVSNKVNGNNTEYTVNAEKTTVSAAAGGAVKVNAGTKNADGVTDYAVDLTDAAKADIAKGVAAKNTVDNKGLTFNADGSTTTGVKKLGDTVAINGDGNIITKADANGIQIGLNKNLNVQSVKAGDTTLNNSGVAVGGNVALTQNGLKAGNVNVSAGGIDAGGNKITRVAPGVVAAGSTDAVNGGQLYAANQAARAAKTEVVAGKNIVVTESQGANGQSVYQVATSDNLTVGSVKAGATTVNDRGISIALPTAHDPENAVSLSPDGLNNGGQRISNVAPGRVGTDAVNLNQLAGLGNALQNNIDRVGKKAYSGVAGAIAQGSIPQVTRPGATGIGVGSGYYGGQSAMAIGVSAMSDGGNWIVKGNFSANTGGHVGVGAGALYQW